MPKDLPLPALPPPPANSNRLPSIPIQRCVTPTHIEKAKLGSATDYRLTDRSPHFIEGRRR